MAWETTMDELQVIQGPGQTVTFSKTLSVEQANAAGMTKWGKASELANVTEHPFDAYTALIEDQAAVRPWLRDAEVLTLIAQATLEGRAVAEAEFQQTAWWRGKNARERQWLLTYESDPKTGQQMLRDSLYQAEEDLLSAGVNDAPPELMEYMSRQLTTGIWSAEYYSRQVTAISDPALGYKVDDGLMKQMGGTLSVGTNQQYEDTVRQLAERWLGPALGNMAPADVARWASKIRTSPDGQAELEEELRRQRVALFPEYEDPTLTYEDIAAPWRSKWNQMWGSTADETDPLFMDILKANNATEAGKMLTREGLNRGIKTVEQGAQSALDRAFRSNSGVVQAR